MSFVFPNCPENTRLNTVPPQDTRPPVIRDAASCCRLCPRMCGANRRERTGFCGCGTGIRAARAALHHWEEPCLSGSRGSGAVFFSGCTLRCCFCQNETISREHFGRELTPRQLADIFLRLQEEGAHNINLVTPTQYLPGILDALDLVRFRLKIPVVYNCGGYERPETIKALDGYVDIWLPDLKYRSEALSRRYSQAPDYFAAASEAILQMIRQTGAPVFLQAPGETADLGSSFAAPAVSTDPGTASAASNESNSPGTAPAAPESPILASGVIIRHLVLPGQKEDSIRLLRWMAEALPKGQYLISLLSQYTPYRKQDSFPELNRRVTTYEYQKVLEEALRLGLDQGFRQQKSSAKEEYTPPFNLEGLP